MKDYKEMTWKERHLTYLDDWYRKFAEEWKNNGKDDRQLYSNMFFQMYEAIETMSDNPPAFVAVAMNNKIAEYRKTMDEIKEYFKNRKAEA